MYRALEDALAASWTLRRKPLESFLLPQAAIGDGLLACADGSLVSLFRIDGARSMTGAEELERFVEVACRRLNSRLAEPGHALHLMLERAPDEAGAQVERVCARTGNQAARLGLALEDVLEERARWLSTAARRRDHGARLLDPARVPDGSGGPAGPQTAAGTPEGLAAGAGRVPVPPCRARRTGSAAPGAHGHPGGAVRRDRHRGGAARRRGGAPDRAGARQRLRHHRAGLASGDRRERQGSTLVHAGPRDRASRDRGLSAAAGAPDPHPRSRAHARRHPHRRPPLRRPRHDPRTPVVASLRRADGRPRRGRPPLPLLDPDRGRRSAPPRRRRGARRLRVHGVLTSRQPGRARCHARTRRAGRGVAGRRAAAPRHADLGDAGGRRRRARAPARPPAADRRRLGRVRVLSPRRRSPGGIRRLGPRLLLRRHRRARARAPLRGAPPAARLPSRAAGVPGGQPHLQGAGRQDAALVLRGGRGPRLRAHPRHPRTGQVGADEQPHPRPHAPVGAGQPAAGGHHRHRPLVLRPDLADTRGAAAGAKRRRRDGSRSA